MEKAESAITLIKNLPKIALSLKNELEAKTITKLFFGGDEKLALFYKGLNENIKLAEFNGEEFIIISQASEEAEKTGTILFTSDVTVNALENEIKKTGYYEVVKEIGDDGSEKIGVRIVTKTGSKAKLLAKLDNFADLKTWVNSLDDAADASLLSKLDGLDNSYLTKLNTDIVHTKYGPELKSLLKESPDDLTNVWKRLKDDPAYSWQLSKTDPQWQKWSQREFFKDITAKGKGFERDVCLTAFKNRSSAKYAELKSKFQADFGKNLDDYDMYSQVQLKYSGDDYFVEDQLFVKRNALGDIEDLVVIENKLSSTTPLTTPQSIAFNKNSFTVRSVNVESITKPGQFLKSGDNLIFSVTKQWYKVHDGASGDIISGISKMN